MKKVFFFTLIIFFASLEAFTQNVNGQSTVCEDDVLNYLAVESGGNTHRKWLGINNSNLSSGSVTAEDITIDFNTLSGYTLLLGWENTSFGFGGELDIEIEHLDAGDGASANETTGTLNVYADSQLYAAHYQWAVTGFGLTGTHYTTSTTTTGGIGVPSGSSPGTVKVRVYYQACGSYGPWSPTTSYP